jgi:hypothetical protein
MTARQLTEAFNERFHLNKSETGIRTACNRRGIKCGRRGHLPGTYFPCISKAESVYIKKHYRKYSISELTRRINEIFGDNKRESQVKSFTSNHHIQSGRSGCFPKGNAPWNANTKGTGVMKRNRTTFRKGNIPGNRRRASGPKGLMTRATSIKKREDFKEKITALLCLNIAGFGKNIMGKFPQGIKSFSSTETDKIANYQIYG